MLTSKHTIKIMILFALTLYITACASTKYIPVAAPEQPSKKLKVEDLPVSQVNENYNGMQIVSALTKSLEVCLAQNQ